jgi:hypothetical protein
MDYQILGMQLRGVQLDLPNHSTKGHNATNRTLSMVSKTSGCRKRCIVQPLQDSRAEIRYRSPGIPNSKRRLVAATVLRIARHSQTQCAEMQCHNLDALNGKHLSTAIPKR